MPATKPASDGPQKSTTQGKQKLLGDEAKYNNLLLLEDIRDTLSNVVTVYKGKDERARSKLGPQLDKTFKAVNLLLMRMQESVRLEGKLFMAQRVVQQKKKETNSSIKRIDGAQSDRMNRIESNESNRRTQRSSSIAILEPP
jgi:hypothetical protein